MDLAIQVSHGSKCERRKVGAVIIDKEGRVVSTGYNGTPKGYVNDCEEEGVTLPIVLHAELNAILFSKISLIDCTMYVTLSPCLHCAACILQTGLKKIIYLEKYRDTSGIDLLNDKIKQYAESTDGTSSSF